LVTTLLVLGFSGHARADQDVTDGRFTNVYVFPSPSKMTWENYLASLPASERPANLANFSRQSIDAFTEALMNPAWPSYFGALYQYGGINPPQFFGSYVASQACVDAALKDLNNGVLEEPTIRSLANCHEDGMDPSPQVNLIFSPDIKVGEPAVLTANGPNMCGESGFHPVAYHGFGLNTPNFTVLPTGLGCTNDRFSTFTVSMSHEIVEALSDPAEDAHGADGGDELADQCEKIAFPNWGNYTVTRYRSDNDNACWPDFIPNSQTLTWILAEGSPVVRFTGDTHSITLNVPDQRATTTAAASDVQIWIQTGGDDLRGGSHLNDDANVVLTFDGGSTLTTNINNGNEWGENQTHFARLTLPAGGLPVDKIRSITLSTQFGGGIDGDNWNVDKVALLVSVPSGTAISALPQAVTEDWLDVSGGPLIRFTGDTHDLLEAVPVLNPDPGPLASALDLIVDTGNDDLRGGGNPGDNADVTFSLRNGTSFTVNNINDGGTWSGWTEHTVSIPLPPAGLRGGDIRSLTLHTGFGGGVGGDNWNVERLQLRATLAPAAPVVTSVTPNAGACDAPTNISIAGSGFTGATSVAAMPAYGAGSLVPLTNVTVGPSAISATVPSSVGPGPSEIVVTTPLGTSIQPVAPGRTDLFYVGAVITSVSPSQGPIAGGTQVTLSGNCFDRSWGASSPFQVYFGSQKVQPGFDQCVSATQCVVYSPAAATGGTVDVTVSYSGAQSATHAADQFTYTGPFIAHLNPDHGPITGGTAIEINGGGFPPYLGTGNNLPLMFGATPASALCLGSSVGETTDCTTTSPAYPQAGPVQVVATAYGMHSPASPDSVFTFDAYPQLTKLVLPDPGTATQPGIFLNGNAPAGGAAISISSSDPGTVRPANPTVTVPAGAQWANVPFVTLPSPVAKQVTLTASYEGSTTQAIANIGASPALMVNTAQTLGPDQTGSVQISLNVPAPDGGATVQLASDDPQSIAVPAANDIVIPAGSYSASFGFTSHYVGKGKWVEIKANYNGNSATGIIWVASAPAKPGPCKKIICPKGSYPTQDGCGCQHEPPQ
jgi:hypothetical protein